MTRHYGTSNVVLGAEVAAALAAGAPVVALESTIITHGMPYPANAETALAVEACVRAEGAIPATIAIVEGKIRVGLTSEEVHAIAQPRPGLLKIAAKDLGFALATGASGGTTVSATMRCAALAGISVFATGGIGGVHRGAETTFDVSSDLTELAQTPVIVVSAGCKSILDIPKTNEMLETLGVPVVGLGTTMFPAFHSRESEVALQLSVDSPDKIAEMFAWDRRLGRNNGILVANPIPAADEIPFSTVSTWVNLALDELERKGIEGKGVTPFLLEALNRLSGGASLTANIALVRNNAKVAARIAAALR